MKYIILSAVFSLFLLSSCCNTPKENNDMNQNETLEVLKTRRSIRAYQDSVPPMELIEKVLEAGTYAPTGKATSRLSSWL